MSYLINYLNKNKIPASNVYVPLHHHDNFNIKKNKSKSFPNIDLNYKKKTKLPIAEEFSYKRLFEISIHPPVNKNHINYLFLCLQNFEKKFFNFK